VPGFEVGADDCVVKPFSPRELLACIHARLRRAHARQTGAPVRVGVAQAGFPRHRLTRDGEPQEVTTREMALLRCLVEHRGEVVSRETLLDEVWGIRARSKPAAWTITSCGGARNPNPPSRAT